MHLTIRLLAILDSTEKRQFSAIMALTFLMATLDVMGVASIMPFIALLANPSLIETNPVLNSIYSTLHFVSPESFVYLVGVSVFGVLMISLSVKALTTFLQLRFGFFLEYRIGKRLFEGYLSQPYDWFLNRHSAELGKTILNEVSTVITLGFMPLIVIVSQGLVVVFIFVLLVLVEPVLSLSVGSFLALAYLVIFLSFSRFLNRLGKERVVTNEQRFIVVNEVFGAAKEIKARGIEKVYADRFESPARQFALANAMASIVAQLPRFALEALAFGGMLLLVLFLTVSKSNFSNAIPTIALYAFAGYRLLPALQQIYASSTQIRVVGPSLEIISAGLKKQTNQNHPVKSMPCENVESFKFTESIELKNISYAFPGTDRRSVSDLNLKIYANKTVAFVGATGSGKSTTMDLILGLISPDSGMIKVDGKEIGPNAVCKWQDMIGYVPQQIFLLDDTITANIAFGVAREKVDEKAVLEAAKMAQLHEFITDETVLAYETVVGERGVRLSGGQRQRIGLARALYNRPRVLLLDEATSALDSVVEQKVMNAIRNTDWVHTIIMVAHRLSTVRDCDEIFLMEDGKLLKKGTFDYLVRTEEIFRKMAQST